MIELENDKKKNLNFYYLKLKLRTYCILRAKNVENIFILQ